ncbi:MAG: hypothetical protein ABR599_05730, partial [Gemmatimonadota bacterium]
PRTDPERIASALAAAPAGIAAVATVVTVEGGGHARVLRRGSGAFTCFPDDPATAGHDPVCADAGGLAWAEAWRTRSIPHPTRAGVVYMLAGGPELTSPASRLPCHEAASSPAPAAPHLMLVGLTALPEQPGASASAHPFVMGAGTPYAHLMVPVALPLDPTGGSSPS